MSEQEVVIVSAVRTGIGSFLGSLKDVSAVELGALVIQSAIQRAGVALHDVDDVMMGNVLQAGLGQNPARQAALAAGMPIESTATTINQVCGSGLKAVHLAYQAIVAGESTIVVAGGMENMSQAPYLMKNVRNGMKTGHFRTFDSMIQDGLWCALSDVHMGITAENIKEQYHFSRVQLDQYAVESQQKAAAALEEGKFKAEIVPVPLIQRDGSKQYFQHDEYIRPETTFEKLAKLKPAFKKNGAVTAGNASGLNDGAAALVLMSANEAKKRGLEPLAMIRGNAIAGVDPAIMGIGPVPAIKKALARAGVHEQEIDLVEANEAFAAQALAVASHFTFPSENINVNGGAIALGHPIGASGARVLVTLLHEMNRRGARYGLATLCIGGGQGIATVVEGNR